MKFNGIGNSFNAQAPTNPHNEYRGVLMYVDPQVDADGNLLNIQALDLGGHGMVIPSGRSSLLRQM